MLTEADEVEGVLQTILQDCRVLNFPGGRLYHGIVKPGFEDSLPDIRRWFEKRPGTLLAERANGRIVLTYQLTVEKRVNLALHLGLVAGAVITLLVAGAFPPDVGIRPLDGYRSLFAGIVAFLRGNDAALVEFLRRVLTDGVPFCFGMLAILAAHEGGHYVASRRYGMSCSLPYFIPSPMWPGTFGAVIRLRTPMLHRRALIDVGAAGPLAGIAATVPILLYGIHTSKLVPAGTSGIAVGSPILMDVLIKLVHGTIPPGFALDLSPLAVAGWFGLLITSLNLLPVGQLDGGHVLYALVGRAQGCVGWAFVALVSYLALFVWPGWIVWLMLMLFLIRVKHPRLVDEEIELSPGRVVIGVVCIVVFLLSFMPLPIAVIERAGV